MEDYKKKYEELYERISNLVRDYDCVSGLIDVSEELKSILNESQESGDERIRKGLIHYFKEQDGILTAISGNVSTRDALAWIEKQGEKVDAIENFDTEFEKQVSCLIASTINKEHEYNKDFVKWTANTLLNYAKQELEKQGEQKPTDKVEPKFKVGDWIVYNRNDYSREIIQVYDIRDGRYYFTDNVHFSWSVKECDEKCHLWTIQDAKDGDVLALNGEVFIYANRKQLYSIAAVHCFVDSAGIFYFDGEFGYTEKRNSIHPATKEQRNLLFQKMKEVGYEWDNEKKELKKIELNPAFCHHEVDLSGCSEEYRKAYYDGWNNCNQQHSQLKAEQKPAWSEEDEKLLNLSLENLTELKNRFGEKYGKVGDCILWLKSLKERYGWKPTDEQMKQLGWVAEQNKDNIIGKELMSLYQDLKKLKEE